MTNYGIAHFESKSSHTAVTEAANWLCRTNDKEVVNHSSYYVPDAEGTAGTHHITICYRKTGTSS